jgi:membrane glycosyltransferase
MTRWHRFYFANGILSYLTGPLILALTLSGTAAAARNPEIDFGSAGFFFLMCLVLVPKLLGIFRVILLRDFHRHSSAPRALLREICSTFGELALSLLVAPLLFYLHLRTVLELLVGQCVPWEAQKRHANDPISWVAAARVFAIPTVIGGVWLALGVLYAPNFLLYLLPVTIGWILAVPIAVLTSRPSLGAACVRWRLFESDLRRDELAALGGFTIRDHGEAGHVPTRPRAGSRRPVVPVPITDFVNE